MKNLKLDGMEPIAKKQHGKILKAYSPLSEVERRRWTLGKIETETEGIFEIYIPHDSPSDAKVISQARVD